MKVELKEGLWYFAHPYTSKDKDGNYVSAAEEANFRLACYRASALMEIGYNVYSPISHTHPIHLASPAFLSRHEHDMWYVLDNHFLANCNFKGIILAPLWETSKGCKAEKRWFEDNQRVVEFYGDLL